MAKEISDWSTTAGSNNFTVPDGAPEGWTLPQINDTAREGMAVHARNYKDNNGSLTTGGTSTAYTVTLNSQHAAWFTGLRFRAKVNATCGATPTINPTGSGALGAKSLYFSDGTQVTTGGLISGGMYDFVYDGTNVQVIGVTTPVAAASESVAGKAELATQAETNTGTDDARIVTPLKLTSWTPAVGTVTAATDDKVLLADTSASGVLKQALVSDIITAARPSVALYQNQQTSGTNGPDFATGSWQTFPLTTEVYDAGAIGSLSSNQITLGAGTYEIFASCSTVGASGPVVTVWRLRLRNVTDGVTLDQGPQSGALGAATAGMAFVSSYFTLAGSKAIELQVYNTSNNPPALSAMSTGDVEVYASVYIRKIA